MLDHPGERSDQTGQEANDKEKGMSGELRHMFSARAGPNSVFLSSFICAHPYHHY